MFEGSSSDPIFYRHIKYGKENLIGGRDIPPKSNLKQRPLAANVYFQFQFQHVALYATSIYVIIQNFTQTAQRQMTVPTAALLTSSSISMCEVPTRKHPKMAEPYLRSRI